MRYLLVTTTCCDSCNLLEFHFHFISSLKHSRPCFIRSTITYLRLVIANAIQHGRSCCKHYDNINDTVTKFYKPFSEDFRRFPKLLEYSPVWRLYERLRSFFKDCKDVRRFPRKIRKKAWETRTPSRVKIWKKTARPSHLVNKYISIWLRVYTVKGY